ncbi:MAG: hypothetical protein Q8L06_15685 [Pseudohongiella sp.]|nr:hypothetical protein [Pseudohongiella sp.]
MPRAILALRRYPIAILMALVLFLCSLLIATNSIGTILINGGVLNGGGGEDQGSGMGGTGKSGVPGDSGFGGTGGPSPFLGETDTDDRDLDENATSIEPQDGWPAPWLSREQEVVSIPAEIAPLIEIQRNPPQDPFLDESLVFPGEPDALRILDEDSSVPSLYMRQLVELVNTPDVSNGASSGVSNGMSTELPIESPRLEISVQIPVILAPEPAALPEILQPELTQEPALAASNAEELPEIVTETNQPDPRQNTERVQRPELPPFQRMRPAVDRASIAPARPQPMRI